MRIKCPAVKHRTRRAVAVSFIAAGVLCAGVWARSYWRHNALVLAHGCIASNRGGFAIAWWDGKWFDDNRLHWVSAEPTPRPPMFTLAHQHSLATGDHWVCWFPWWTILLVLLAGWYVVHR